MFSHIMIGTNDLEKATAFYNAMFEVLGVPAGRQDRHRVFWRSPTGTFAVTTPIDGEAATFANGGTIGFACESKEQVDAWHATGLANGAVSIEDPPGPRGLGSVKLYLAYLRDLDGNKICAMHRLPAEG